jgi:hypothetical protein
MSKTGIKKVAIFLILFYIFLNQTGYTTADIFAERIIRQNKFAATTLDFSTRNSFNNASANSLFRTLGLVVGGFDLGALKLKLETKGKAKYQLSFERTNGDEAFCSRLTVKVLDSQLHEFYQGSLVKLALNETVASVDDAKDFVFFIGLDDQSAELKNKICEFNLKFKTYRERPDEQGGIFAQRLVSNVVSSGNW